MKLKKKNIMEGNIQKKKINKQGSKKDKKREIIFLQKQNYCANDKHLAATDLRQPVFATCLLLMPELL